VKNRIYLITIICLIFLTTIETYILINKSIKIKKIESMIPVHYSGNKIDYFDVRDSQKNTISIEEIKKNELSLVFVFSEPCSPCNKNLLYWKKISAIFSLKIPIYGVTLKIYKKNDRIKKAIKANFNIYVPLNLNKFKKTMKLNSNLAQTIILKKNLIYYIKLGDLDPNDYFEIVRKINKEIK